MTDTKASSPGETQNVAAVPPPISPLVTALRLVAIGEDVPDHINHAHCEILVIEHNVCRGLFMVIPGDFLNSMPAILMARGEYLWKWAANDGTLIAFGREVMAHEYAEAPRLRAWRSYDGAWKVFDPRVSALLPRIDAQLED